MKKLIGLLICFLVYFPSIAQFNVNIVFDKPASTLFSHFFIAGNINNWNPAHKSFAFNTNDNSKYHITFKILGNDLEYKVTAGSWQSVEVDKANKDIANRKAFISSDTTLYITIDNFKSNVEEKKSTASSNVRLESSEFYFPSLKANKKIWVYLPLNYNPKIKYPVLYMHDGQNVFDAATSFSGEWGVDEYLDSTKTNLIVVAIENGGENRLTEYSCDTNTYVKTPRGNAYCYDVVSTLMPYINQKYNTSRAQEDNYLLGSSMGANISLYMSINYSTVFGKIGLYSPAFWINKKEIVASLSKIKKKLHTKFYFYVGTNESSNMVSDAKQIKALLDKKTRKNAAWIVKENATHTEIYWQKNNPSFFKFLITN